MGRYTRAAVSRTWMCTGFGVLALAGWCLSPSLPSGVAAGQQASTSPEVKTSSPATKNISDAGFPVTDALVNEKCGTCHQPDAKGNLSRISYIRTTPEGWEEAIKRMVRLNGLQLSPEDARHILRYLSDSHGLAPEEAAPVEYLVERRTQDENFKNADAERACAACHALARPLSWHRTPADWELLKNMHIAFFPNVEMTAFLRVRRHADPAADPKAKQPVDEALEFIEKSAPFRTPEWSEWQAAMQTPRLAGRWLVSGHEPGKGDVYGEVTVTRPGDGDTFSTKTTLTYPATGNTVSFAGSSVVYTGYAWRGRSTAASAGTEVDAPKTIREVMMVSKDQSTIKGRWFWGTYDAFGMDVTLRRAGAGPAVLGVDTHALKAGTAGAKIRIFGDALPENLTAADINLGTGVKVDSIASQQPGVVTVVASVDPHATPGMRLVGIKDATLPNAFAVYDHIDFLKVVPDTALSHLGSAAHPVGYTQFEARAYSNGPDGKPATADDIDLGPVAADWKLQEFVASYGDDDTQFVGKIDGKSGLFTPSSDGPDPKRRSMRNNYGDVWAVASYKPEGSDNALIGRSYLIVAVPQYVDWDQPEVASDNVSTR